MATANAIQVTKAELVELFQALEFKTCNKWPEKRLLDQVQNLPNLVDDETDLGELNELLDDLLEAVEAEEEVTIAKKESPKEEEAPKQAKAKAAVKPKKQQPKTKKGKFTVECVDLTAEQAADLLGIRDAEEGDSKSYPYIDEDGNRKKFVMDRNHENRPFSIGLANDYKNQMLYGTFAGQPNSRSTTCNGESCTVDWNGNVISMAHRGSALWLAEMERKRLNKLAKEGEGEEAEQAMSQLEDYGCNGQITMPTILVQGVDPACADTADTGKKRSLADVLFRRAEFQDKEWTDSDLKKLATILSVAIKHVQLRIYGYHVKGAPKLHNQDAVKFLEKHPLLKQIVVFVYETNKGDEDVKNPLDRYQLSLGYIAAHIYLAMHSETNADKYWAGDLKMDRVPSKELKEKAEQFWQDFANIDIAGRKDTPSAVWQLKTVLHESKEKKVSLDRDGLATVTTRAMKAYMADPGRAIRTNNLRTGLVNRAGASDFEPEFERFGGLDQETVTATETEN